MERHHTYPAVHQEHKAWRQDLLKARKNLDTLNEKIKKQIAQAKTAELKIKIKMLENKIALQQEAIAERLKRLTQADTVMSQTKNAEKVLSQKLFAINNKLRQDLLNFEQKLSDLQSGLDEIN